MSDEANAMLRLRPLRREAKAMRLALGWSVETMAAKARITVDRVKAIEAGELAGGVSYFSESMGRALRSAGVTFDAPDIGGGSFCISFDGPGSANDRQAILAALALMSATVARLALAIKRGAGIDPKAVRAALDGRAALAPAMKFEAFRQLERAGCHFEASPRGGWDLIGCDPKGWRK